MRDAASGGMRTSTSILGGVLLTLAAAANATAQPAQTPREELVPEEVEVKDVYGLQTLALDALGVAIVASGEAMDSDGVVITGLVVTGLGPAAIHVAHGNPGRAMLSAALRPSLMYAGAMLGASAASCSDGEFLCGLGEVVIGGAVGYGAAVIIDAALLARSTRTERQWTPTLAARHDGWQVGVVGTF